ncbi:MAG: TIGR03435 family protein [Acidobacteria bacterium]|nr:TIGR03435 family protein [Acidobacteriota bacterium]
MAGMLLGQTEAPKFEVASIRPTAPGAIGTTVNADKDRVTIRNMSLTGLIEYAYNIRRFQISGAQPWMQHDRYDLIAKYDAPDEPLTVRDRRTRLRMRDLLAERFGLVLREETKEMPVLALRSERNGRKLTANPTGPGATTINRNDGVGMSRGRGVTAPDLAATLGMILGQPVIDETGAEGRFDYELKWTGDGGPGPTIQTAVREQLGMRLESKRGPVNVQVIVKAEKPTEN